MLSCRLSQVCVLWVLDAVNPVPLFHPIVGNQAVAIGVSAGRHGCVPRCRESSGETVVSLGKPGSLIQDSRKPSVHHTPVGLQELMLSEPVNNQENHEARSCLRFRLVGLYPDQRETERNGDGQQRQSFAKSEHH